MVNVIIREASDKDIPIILGLLYDLGRPKPQKDSDVHNFRKLVTKYVKGINRRSDQSKRKLVCNCNYKSINT